MTYCVTALNKCAFQNICKYGEVCFNQKKLHQLAPRCRFGVLGLRNCYPKRSQKLHGCPDFALTYFETIRVKVRGDDGLEIQQISYLCSKSVNFSNKIVNEHDDHYT